MQVVVVIPIRRIWTVVTHRHCGIATAALQQRRSGGRASLNRFRNHRGNRAREISRNRERVRIVEIVHQRVHGQVRQRPMIPLETAYRNRIRINEFPMQELHCGIKRINVEGEGNNRRTVDAVLRRRRLGKRVGNDGEICGNLHAPSIPQASDSYKASIDGITKRPLRASLWGHAGRGHSGKQGLSDLTSLEK